MLGLVPKGCLTCHLFSSKLSRTVPLLLQHMQLHRWRSTWCLSAVHVTELKASNTEGEQSLGPRRASPARWLSWFSSMKVSTSCNPDTNGQAFGKAPNPPRSPSSAIDLDFTSFQPRVIPAWRYKAYTRTLFRLTTRSPALHQAFKGSNSFQGKCRSSSILSETVFAQSLWQGPAFRMRPTQPALGSLHVAKLPWSNTRRCTTALDERSSAA